MCTVATVTVTDMWNAYSLLSELWLSHNEADPRTFYVLKEMATYNTGSAAELSGGQLTMGIIGCLPDNVQQVICMSSLSVALSRTCVATFCIHMCCNIINGNFWPLVFNLINLSCRCSVIFLIFFVFSYLHLLHFL